MNSFETIQSLGASFMFVVITNKGECTWKPYQMFESTCKVDMTHFPYDTQKCELMVRQVDGQIVGFYVYKKGKYMYCYM